MRALAWVLVGALFAFALVAAPASARSVVLDASEGPDCIPAKVYCFIDTNRELASVEAGEEIELTLRAVGTAPHNVFVTTADQAASDPLRDTASSAAFAQTDTAEPGAEVNVTFTVPVDAERLYLWCDVTNHEAGGMWLEVQVVPAEGARDRGNASMNETDDGDGGSMEGGDDGDSIPVPWLAPVVAVAAAAALVGRRRA